MWSLAMPGTHCISYRLCSMWMKETGALKQLSDLFFSFLSFFRMFVLYGWVKKCMLLFDRTRRVCLPLYSCILSLSIYHTVNTIKESYSISATIYRYITRLRTYFWEAIKKNKAIFLLYFVKYRKEKEKPCQWTFICFLSWYNL
jgi:hypothetical protein